MKIGLLIYGSLETISGGNIYDNHLLNFLEGRGDQVEMISIPWRPTGYLHHLWDNFSRRLYFQLRDLEVDCLIQDELCHPSLFKLNWRLKGNVSYPIISLVHHLRSSEAHPAWLKPLYYGVEKSYLRSVDGFIFNSRTTKTSVQKSVPKLPPHVVAFPGGDGLGNGHSQQEIRQRTQQQRPLRILFLGSLTRRKGLHTLLDACEQLEQGLVELTIIGSQAAEVRHARQIQARIARMKKEIPIQVQNALPAESLADQLAHQDILVVPSSYEGFGIVYLEGMAFGLPAIATTSGAAHETIQHGQNGFLIQPGDNQALASYLQDLATQRSKLLSLSLNARQTFNQGPTWEQMGKTIHQYLKTWHADSSDKIADTL